MVRVIVDSLFERKLKRIKDATLKEKVRKQVCKILTNPLIGKPMRYERKLTREVYISPFRLSYDYDKEAQVLTFLDLYRKEQQ